MGGKTNCDCCLNYTYDYEYDCYMCEMDLDEDEMARFITNSYDNCPFFQFNNEYMTVNKQI